MSCTLMTCTLMSCGHFDMLVVKENMFVTADRVPKENNFPVTFPVLLMDLNSDLKPFVAQTILVTPL